MLQGAIIFSYINAFWALLGLLTGTSGLALIWLLGGAGGVGIANHRKWGYYGALVAGLAYLTLQVLALFVWTMSFGVLLNLLFGVFLVALLLHPSSRAYVSQYFR